MDGNRHPLPALEDLEPARPKVVLRPGLWEAGAEQQLWTCADRAWSMTALIALAAPRLSPAALVIEIFEEMTTRDSRLGLTTRRLSRAVFEAPLRGRRQRDLPPLPVPWDWPLFADVVLDTVWSRRSCRTHYSRERRQCGRVQKFSFLGVSGCGHISDLEVPRGRSRAVQVGSLHQICVGARYLISRAPEDGGLVSPSLDCAKTLFHKRVGSGRQVAAFSDGLTLLGLLPELPPEGTVCIVEPLVMAGPEVGGILRHRESMLVAPEQRDAARPALAHASDEELGKIRAELLQRGIVVEIDLNDRRVVDWFRILVWVFGVVKSGVRAPLATLIVRLFVNAIPSNSLQRRILGDGEKMPERDEWLYVCLGENEVSLWSIGEIVLNVGPVVVWFCMIVWVFDVFKSGFPAPPATVIVGLFVTAIPSKSLHRQILGDGEKIPDMQEWWYVCLRENEVSLWSIGVIFEGFRVFSVPVPWQRWIILFKPIRQLVKGSADRKGVDHGSGGNAPRDHPSNVRVQRD